MATARQEKLETYLVTAYGRSDWSVKGSAVEVPPGKGKEYDSLEGEDGTDAEQYRYLPEPSDEDALRWIVALVCDCFLNRFLGHAPPFQGAIISRTLRPRY